jgi:hypothetical protein
MKDKIINLSDTIKDLNGKELVQDTRTLGQILASALVSTAKGDVLKYFGWATKFNKNETITIDRSDYETLKKFVLDNESMTILVKGQILPLLENDKPEEKEKLDPNFVKQ